MTARLILICGLPGSGKTTVAASLERRLDAIRLSADEWMIDLGIDLFDSEARAAVERMQWRLAERLLTLDQRVIIEWGSWGRSERDHLRERARGLGAAAEFHYLHAPLDVLWHRVQARGLEQRHGARALTRQDMQGYEAAFDAPDEAERSLYDKPLVPTADAMRGQIGAASTPAEA